MVNFALTEEQLEFQKWLHGFAETEIRPVASQYDESEEFPWEVVKRPPRSACTVSTSTRKAARTSRV